MEKNNSSSTNSGNDMMTINESSHINNMIIPLTVMNQIYHHQQPQTMETIEEIREWIPESEMMNNGVVSNNEEEIIIVEQQEEGSDDGLVVYTDDSHTDIGDDIQYTTALLDQYHSSSSSSSTMAIDNTTSSSSAPYKKIAKKISNILQTSVSRTISGGKSLLGVVKKPLMTGNDEQFEVIITDPNNNNSDVFQFKRVTSPNTLQRKVFNLSSVYSKVIGWRKKATRQIRRRINYDRNYLHPPTSSDLTIRQPFHHLASLRRKKQLVKKAPTNCENCAIPQELWAYNILPYLSWTDMLIMRLASKMLLITVQEQDETWNELFEAKHLKYFQEPTDLWRNTRNYFYLDLDEAIVKQYFEEILFEKYRKLYTSTYCKPSYSEQEHAQIIPSTLTIKQEGFVSYLSLSRTVSERKKQINQRKNLSQQEKLKNVEHRSAWHRIFTILISILSAIASLVCVTVKDFAFQQSTDWKIPCSTNGTSGSITGSSSSISSSTISGTTLIPDSYNLVMDKSWTIPFIPVYIGMLFILGTILYFWLRYYVNNNKYSLENDGRPRSPNEIYLYMTLTVVCCILFFVFLNIRLVHPYCSTLIESYYSGTVELTEAEASSLLLSEVFNNGVVLCSPLLAILGLFTIYLLRSTQMGVQYIKYSLRFSPKYFLIGIGMWKFATPFIIWLFSSFSVILFILYLVFDPIPALVPAIPIMILHLGLILVFGWSILYIFFMFITCSLDRKLVVENLMTCIYGFLMISSPILFYVLLGLGFRSGYVAIPCCVFFLTLLLYGMNYVNYLEDLLDVNEERIPFS